MLVTLFLISANVYNSVEVLIHRGFSYVEVWMLGTQFPILIALFEYGLILYWKPIGKKSEETIKILDFAALIFSFVFSISFTTLFWLVTIIYISSTWIIGEAGGAYAAPPPTPEL